MITLLALIKEKQPTLTKKETLKVSLKKHWQKEMAETNPNSIRNKEVLQDNAKNNEVLTDYAGFKLSCAQKPSHFHVLKIQ